MPDTLHPSAAVIASWPPANYIDPTTRGPALVELCIGLSVVGILVVAARLYTRLFLTRAAGLDDALIVVGLLFGIALSVLVIIGNQVFWSGHHVWDIPINKFSGHRFNIWNAEWCYVISTSATKISVLLFYRRISIKFSKAFIIATWAGIIFNILYMVSFCLVLLLLCSPISAYWKSFDPFWVLTHSSTSWKCGKENIELPLSGVFSVIGDFYSALLPILVIFNLNLSQRQKLSLYALFSMAFLIVAAGIARTILMWQMLNSNWDFTWVLWEMWIWGVVELYVAIIAASAPALKPFVRNFIVNPVKSAAAATTSRRRGGARIRTKPHTEPKVNQLTSKPSFYRSQHASSTKATRLSLRESALSGDLENLGVAHGGRDFLTSWDDFIGKEIDNDELDTRRYVLQPDKHGKVAIAQVWYASRPQSSRSSITSNGSTIYRGGRDSWGNVTLGSVPAYRPRSMPIAASVVVGGTPPPPPKYACEWESSESQVRNFSLPYSSCASVPSTPTRNLPSTLMTRSVPATPTTARMVSERASWSSPSPSSNKKPSSLMTKQSGLGVGMSVSASYCPYPERRDSLLYISSGSSITG